MTNNEPTNHEKAQIFLDRELPVHIVKHNGGWLNGIITDLGSDFLIINEKKFGTTLVFMREISKIETYQNTKRGEENE